MRLSLSTFMTLFVALLSLVLGACSSQHLLVKRADFEAAKQCLQARQEDRMQRREQQNQLLETLSLMQETLALQQQNDSLIHQLRQSAKISPPSVVEAPGCEQPERELSAPGGLLDKLVVGTNEPVALIDLGLVLDARIDTGATTSSLDARDIELFERDGEEWVGFKVENPQTGKLITLERQRARGVRIVQSSSEEAERRPVVRLRITLGSHTQLAEFTLTSRSHLESPLLIGRNVLRDVMLVDVAQSNITRPQTSEAPAEGRDGVE